MNSRLFFVLLLGIVGVAIFGLSVKPKQSTATTAVPKEEVSEQPATQQPQNKSLGAVDVEIIPINIESGDDLIFQMTMNTHSVELEYDYTQIATLTDDQGNTYKPITWTGGNSGHHLEGELVFAALPKNPENLTLTLEDIDNESGTFTWKL